MDEISTELTVLPSHDAALMPAMTVEQAVERFDQFSRFRAKILKKDIDYGRIPGTNKDVLLKPGAEKLCALFGLAPSFEVLDKVEQWDTDEPFFHFRFRCTLTRHGIPVGEGIGSCNSRETKYRWRWVPESEVPERFAAEHKVRERDGAISEFAFAIDKGETGGPYGKPPEYWQRFREAIEEGSARKTQRTTRTGKQLDAWEIGSKVWRVPNPEIADQVNTVEKMAQKRALIAATLVVTAASDVFTQDLEDNHQPSPLAGTPPPGEPPPRRSSGPDESIGIILEHIESWMPGQGSGDVITTAQAKRLFAIAKPGDRWSDEGLKALIAKAGFSSSKDLPRALYDKLCTYTAARSEAEWGGTPSTDPGDGLGVTQDDWDEAMT